MSANRSGFVCFEGKAGECIMGRTDVSAEVGTVEEICRMIDLVSDTMDDYLYICDLYFASGKETFFIAGQHVP